MQNTYAIILAGGSGERFWPLSTRARPKQFISLFSGRPLLSLAVERLEGLIPPQRIFVITAQHLIESTAEAVWEVPRGNIIGEPCKRDTAPAIAVACGLARRQNPASVVCILTADQLMSDEATFQQTLSDAVKVARNQDAIVTIGIQPTVPATGFGYIEAGQAVEEHTLTSFFKAKRFVEKPDVATAARYLASGKFFWNSGMFIWRTEIMLQALKKHAPELGKLCVQIQEASSTSELEATMCRIYPGLRSISIDYAVMEHLENIIVARGSFGWDDVGSWPAVAGHFKADQAANVIVGSCEAIEASNNIVISENRLTALIGVDGLVVVHSDNATLICPQTRAQEVKKILQRITERPDGEQYV